MAMIQVKNFAKAFDGRPVHQDVNFSVHQGECLGLVGGSGIGKSVVLRSLIGLEKPDHGEIWIEGEEISKLKERQLIPIRQKVAYAFQNGALFDSMSVYENLAYPLREHLALTAYRGTVERIWPLASHRQTTSRTVRRNAKARRIGASYGDRTKSHFI